MRPGWWRNSKLRSATASASRAAASIASASAVDVPNGLSQSTALPASSAAPTHCGWRNGGACTATRSTSGCSQSARTASASRGEMTSTSVQPVGLVEHGRDDRLPEASTDDADTHRSVTTHARNVARLAVTPPAYRRSMGYRGKVEQQEQAREMRARNMTLQDIATELGVAKSSVSLWVRDVPFTPSKRRTGPQRRPHPFHEAKLAQIAALNAEGVERIGTLSDAAFLAAGVALYAGEGAKTRWRGDVREHRPDDGPVLLRVASSVLRDRRGAPARARLPPRGSRSRRRRARTGQTSRAFRVRSSEQPYRAVADPSIRRHTSTSSAASTSTTRARRRIVGSWGSSGRCYRQSAIPG